VRVLVVDDEPNLASLICRWLGRHGHATDVARTGEEALCRTSVTNYDAVLLDIGLPGISGLETCRRLREQGVTTSILLISAFDSGSDRAHGVEVGADDYLVKPFRLDELIERVHALVRRA
jgi:DNA-binding response OmpR family regulator